MIDITLYICIIILFLYLDSKRLKVVHYSIDSEKQLGQFDGCKIALLTDLHNNSFGKDNANLIDAIEKETPDYIVIAGDMLVGNRGHDYSVAMNLIEKLSKRYPIYYGNGNHEHRLSLYFETKETIYDPYVKKLKELGVHLLINEHEYIQRGTNVISITGLQIQDEFYQKKNRSKLEQDYLVKEIGTIEPSIYQILIAHNPVYFSEYANWGADLVLAGHVHGGIMRIPGIGGVISPQHKLFPKYDGGIFKEKKSTMILSRGLGMHTIKIRILNRPELVLIQLNGGKP